MTAVQETAPAGGGAAPVDGGRRPAAWRVAVAIAHVEAVRLIRHPATVAGLVLSTAIVTLVLTSIVPVVQRETAELAAIALPLAAGVLFGGHLAASRLRRDHMEPLATAAPSTAATRTLGLLIALLGPAAVTAVWTAAVVLLMPLTGGDGTAPITGSLAIADFLAPSATVLLFGALGVALGRWLPAVLAAAFTLPLLAAGLLVAYEALRSRTAVRLLPVADWVDPFGMFELWPRAPWTHLLYVLLLAATVAGVALCRDRAAAIVVAATVACAAGAVAVAVPLVTVWDDRELVTALVRDIRDPAHRLTCNMEPRVQVCVPAGYEAWDARLRAPAADALALLPATARPETLRIQLRSEPWVLAQSLPPQVAAALPPDVRTALEPWPFSSQPPRLLRLAEPGTVPALSLQYRGAKGDAQRLDLALGVLAQATGLRDTVRERERRIRSVWHGADSGGDSMSPGPSAGCSPDLQAREVLTFALAALSDPAARGALEAELDAIPYGWQDESNFDDWFLIPGGGVTGLAASDYSLGSDTGRWSRGAGTLGLAVADRVEAGDLHDEWDRWTDPATAADELVARFGIPALPTPAQLADAAGVDTTEFAPACQ